ncbi:MAG: HD domain-containing phosphohydrolase [Nitrosomonadales bacterium]
MKLIRTRNEPHKLDNANEGPRHTWKLLVVDDEPDVLEVTRLNLRSFRFDERDLEIIEAASAYEAKEILRREKNIAVALIDVVMETDDAGLKLVEFIREELNNPMIRLVIRTGQPGLAPERFVIENYDIDDYRDKTEMTATRLFTTVRSTLKAYRDLKAIDLNRLGLERVLEAAPEIYHIGNISLQKFFEGVLTQVIGLCNLSEGSFISTIPGMIATVEGNDIVVQASTGENLDSARMQVIHDGCINMLINGNAPDILRKDTFIVPLIVPEKPVGFIYIEPTREMSASDHHLIQVAANQCASALENLRLHRNLADAYDNSIEMLAQVAEFKDKTTGGHVRRLDAYTRLIALEMGMSQDEAELYGKASRLHDIGKVGIPDNILQKPGKLTDEEYQVIKTHARIGGTILSQDKHLSLACNIALHHHERWDGSGYPEGILASKLPLATRIVSVLDVFDALVCCRPYKDAWPVEKAATLIREGAGTQFDPVVVKAFLKLLDKGDLNGIIDSAQNFH